MNDILQRHDELGDLLKDRRRQSDEPVSETIGGGVHRRAFLAAASATATLLAASPGFGQNQPPVAPVPAGPAAMPGNVRVERVDGSILLIGIRQETDRVELSSVIGLGRLMYMLDHDDALRVAVLYSQGSDFIGGILDPESWGPVLRSGKFLEAAQFVNPVGTIPPRRQKPLVVAVQGKCQGAGHELFLAADVRVAANNTVFSQPEVTRGHFPAGGAPITFVREAGWANAMHYMLTGDEWGAEEAYRMGLVQYVTAPGEQVDRAIGVARKISAAAPLGIKATIASAQRTLSEGQEAAYAALFPELARLAQSDDHEEYFRAIREKRPPVFHGR